MCPQLRVEREIARDRMAALVDERRRARICMAELVQLRAAIGHGRTRGMVPHSTVPHSMVPHTAIYPGADEGGAVASAGEDAALDAALHRDLLDHLTVTELHAPPPAPMEPIPRGEAHLAQLPHVRSASILPVIAKGGEPLTRWTAESNEGKPGAGGRHATSHATVQPRLTMQHAQSQGILHVEYSRTGLQRRVGMEPPSGVPLRAVKNSSPKIRFPAP
jgi:hypothetical protein